MAARIKQTLDIDVELIGGSKGIFDVAVDGQLVYSKYQTGSFPNNDELIAQIRSSQHNS